MLHIFYHNKKFKAKQKESSKGQVGEQRIWRWKGWRVKFVSCFLGEGPRARLDTLDKSSLKSLFSHQEAGE